MNIIKFMLLETCMVLFGVDFIARRDDILNLNKCQNCARLKVTETNVDGTRGRGICPAITSEVTVGGKTYRFDKKKESNRSFSNVACRFFEPIEDLFVNEEETEKTEEPWEEDFVNGLEEVMKTDKDEKIFKEEKNMNTNITLIDVIGRSAMLEQCAEEASELAFACLKLARFIRGENKVHGSTETELFDHLAEEMADINRCFDEMYRGGANCLIDRGKVLDWEARKYNRMMKRLSEEFSFKSSNIPTDKDIEQYYSEKQHLK